jgi:hypothetical protein
MRIEPSPEVVLRWQEPGTWRRIRVVPMAFVTMKQASLEGGHSHGLHAESRPTSAALDVVLAVILPASVISAIYLIPFVRNPGLLPFGADTAGYMWRTGVVRTLGLHALQPGILPSPIQPLGNRPAYPVVAGILQSIIGVDPATFTWLSPAIFATIAGLAAGALAVDGCKEPRVRAPIYAIGLGGSAYLAWTAVGYAPNLAFDGIALAIAVVVLGRERGRASSLLGGAMLGGGFLMHWMFAMTFASVLLAYAGVVALARRHGQTVREPELRPDPSLTPDALRRVVALLLIGVTIGAVGFLVAAPERPDSLPPVNDPGKSAAVAVKLITRDPGFLLGVAVPLAILAFIVGLRGSRRWPATLIGFWASLFLAGLVAWYGLHLPFPPYRWTAFALGLPILAIAAGPWVAEAMKERVGPHAPIVGVGIALLLAAAFVGGGIHVWWSSASRMTSEERVELGVASRYLGPLPVKTPVIVVVSPRGNLPIDRVFSGLPAERLPSVRVVGARVNPLSPDLGLGIPIPPDSVVLFPLAFNRQEAQTGIEIGSGLRLLAGPAPQGAIEVPPAPRAPSAARMAWYVALSLVTLIVAGWGWSLLIEMRGAGRLAISAAIGMAMLGLLGVALARIGVRPDGPGAIVDLILTIASGFVVTAIVRKRQAFS